MIKPVGGHFAGDLLGVRNDSTMKKNCGDTEGVTNTRRKYSYVRSSSLRLSSISFSVTLLVVCMSDTERRDKLARAGVMPGLCSWYHHAWAGRLQRTTTSAPGHDREGFHWQDNAS